MTITFDNFADMSEQQLLDAAGKLDPMALSYGFVVSRGWIDHAHWDRFTESDWEEFADPGDALRCYLAWCNGLADDYHIERMTAGKCWQERTACVALEFITYDETELCSAVHLLDEYRYGKEE